MESGPRGESPQSAQALRSGGHEESTGLVLLPCSSWIALVTHRSMSKPTQKKKKQVVLDVPMANHTKELVKLFS
jgi:hypothetical protein